MSRLNRITGSIRNDRRIPLRILRASQVGLQTVESLPHHIVEII